MSRLVLRRITEFLSLAALIIGCSSENVKQGRLIPIDAYKSGFFIPYDIKKIREININNFTRILVRANGQEISCFTMN